MRVAHKNSSPSCAGSGATGQPCDEILKRSAESAAGQAAAQGRKLTTGEADAALTVAVPLVVGGAVPILAAESEGMLSPGVGDIVHALKSLIGSSKQGPPV